MTARGVRINEGSLYINVEVTGVQTCALPIFVMAEEASIIDITSAQMHALEHDNCASVGT